ncbi:hypothetical protein LCGC14_0146460 [marine sediment metagenome]|uniref:Uncharacterized protein n=1 Tax=marine sediment metagenome TaxID=412755 RepID=A0A0F9UZZ1_9ZZZZ
MVERTQARRYAVVYDLTDRISLYILLITLSSYHFHLLDRIGQFSVQVEMVVHSF